MPMNIRYPKENIIPFAYYAAIVKSGDLILSGPWHGIVENDQLAESIGPLHIQCICEVPKTTGVGKEITKDDPLEYQAPAGLDTGGKVETCGAAELIMAIALLDAGADDELVLVRLLEYACCYTAPPV